MVDLADARWFPVDLHVPERRYGFLQIDDGVLLRSSFLDTRIEASLAAAQAVTLAAAAAAILPQAPVGWLFHTSFCGSTLAARGLHLPPHAVCLREPLVLRRLADARYSGWPLEGLIEPTLRLLARPWHPQGAVVIKPTHAALNIAVDLMHATPASRAVILTSSLDDFLVSNLKKTPESQAKIPALAERALSASMFARRLPPAALQPPDLLCAAALQWSAQRELAADIVDSTGGARVRMIDMSWLLADLGDAMSQVAHWFGMPLPMDALRRHCGDVATRNAKATESPYGSARRAQEMAMVMNRYGGELARARDWAEVNVLPAMRPEARNDPARWVFT